MPNLFSAMTASYRVVNYAKRRGRIQGYPVERAHAVGSSGIMHSLPRGKLLGPPMTMRNEP